MKTPPVVKIETLEVRWRASVQVDLSLKVEALAKQYGQPTTPDPIAAAVTFRASTRKHSN